MKDPELPGIERAAKFSHGYNLNDKPSNYVGKRRADSVTDLESIEPVVFLAIETVEGLGDSVIAASMSFKAAVEAVQRFSSGIEGEVYPERSYLPSAGSVHMRKEDGSSTPYRVDPVSLS